MTRKTIKSVFLSVVVIALLNTDAFSQTEMKKMLVNGIKREYIVYTPARWNPSRKHPLVLAFHGGGGNAKQAMKHYDFNAIADTAEFLVVYPNGIRKHWNDGRNLKQQKHNDVEFIRQLIVQLQKDYPIDPQRIFSTGISNGGFFSFALALRLPEQIKAIAPVCASISMNLFPEYKPAQTVSLLLINGTDDPIVPYNGGNIGGKFFKRGQCTSTDLTLARYISLNDCELNATTVAIPDVDLQDGCHAERFTYTCQNAQVQLVKVHGGGHTWPGGSQYLSKRIVGNVCRDFSASKVIWNFFRQF